MFVWSVEKGQHIANQYPKLFCLIKSSSFVCLQPHRLTLMLFVFPLSAPSPPPLYWFVDPTPSISQLFHNQALQLQPNMYCCVSCYLCHTSKVADDFISHNKNSLQNGATSAVECQTWQCLKMMILPQRKNFFQRSGMRWIIINKPSRFNH